MWLLDLILTVLFLEITVRLSVNIIVKLHIISNAKFNVHVIYGYLSQYQNSSKYGSDSMRANLIPLSFQGP